MTNITLPKRTLLLAAIFVFELGALSHFVISSSLTADVGGTTSLRMSARRAKRVSSLKPAAPVINRPGRRVILERGKANASEATRDFSSVKYEKARCGDKLVISEQCDDGNTAAGDGCAGDCTIEAGFICNAAQPSVCWSTCGDGKVATGPEKCDDGNTVGGDGCDGKCRSEIGFTCTGSPSVCKVNSYCGNRILEGEETCDDGNIVGGDGCSASCKKE